MSNVILKIDNLTKRYKDKVALDHVSFEIQKGKIYGFIGENGAGKTTTIRSITGLSSIDEGRVELFGLSDSKGLQKARKKMGCLVERPILMLNESAFYNLKMQQMLFGQNDDEKINKLLDRVGLGDVKQKKVKDFSLGMKQRLGIAISLINNPELIILDEPTSGLDPVARDELLDILSEYIGDENRGVLFSTHITADVERIADYVTILHYGKVWFTGSKDELVEKFAVLKGSVDDVTPELMKKLIGYHSYRSGFEALIATDDLAGISSELEYEKASIDEILVYIAKEAKNERHTESNEV